MGKAKKSKKLDSDQDLEENFSGDAEGGDEEVPKTKAKKEKKLKETIVNSDSDDESVKKKKNKKKTKTNDEVDGATEELQELSISTKSKKDKKKGKGGVDSDDEVEMNKANSKPAKKKGKKKKDDSDSEAEQAATKDAKKGGFALLAMSDEEPAEEEDPDVDMDEDEPEEKPKETKKEQQKGKKGKKKKKDEDDEDLDQILAELQMEYSGDAPPKTEGEAPAGGEAEVVEEKEESKKSKKKKKEEKREKEDSPIPGAEPDGGEDEDLRTVKSAAQKKKEKKEREKQKKMLDKTKSQDSVEKVEKPVKVERTSESEAQPSNLERQPSEEMDDRGDDDMDQDDDDKKKKKKKKGKEDKGDKTGKGAPNKKTIAAMQEALKKIKEEEERMAQEEEEKAKREEEAEKARLEQVRLEQERKDRKKAKEKERKERLKAEGKLLSSKQKADRARAEAMIEAMKAMYGGAAPPQGEKPKPKPFTKLKKKKQSDGTDGENETVVDGKTEEPAPVQPTPVAEETNKVEVEIVEAEPVKEEPPEVEQVKDSWDAESSDGEEEKSEESTKGPQEAKKKSETSTATKKEEVSGGKGLKNGSGGGKGGSKDDEETESEEDSEESDDSDSDSEAEEDEERSKTDAEKKKERAIARIKQRQEDALKKQTLDELRAAVVCVLGHVDTGKTKILDKLRRTNVQDGEAGGITQQIGATNVPIDAIKEQSKFVKGFAQMELKIPGLLIIDTPGHESFSNLRSRGSSLCDIAILVVDIMHGLEPQTIESLNLLKQRKTPFVVALNKIDRLYDWQTMNKRDVRDIIKGQAPNTQLEFEQRVNEVVLQFAQQGLNAALFYNNPDVRSYVSLVPTSAITGEGMGNLLAYIVESCQTMLAKRLMFSEELQATVLEVKAIPGLGTTIDVILVNGWLREGDTAVLAGTDAPIVTQIRSLLMPQPMKELRVKNAYVEYKEVKAAQGVKIAAKDLEKVIAGLNLRVAQKSDEVEILREEVGRELKKALSSIKLQERGVYVQASTLGSLEALLEFLRTSSIPYSGIRIGPVVKKDVMKASTMLEHDSQYATILAFDVKIERDAQDLADTQGVKIFQADIIYHLFDKFMQYRDELKQKKRDEFKSIAVFPCKLKILPQFVFNSRDPIVVGVLVEAGVVKEGTPLCVPSKEFVDIGIVTSIEINHKNVETARKGQEVCIKIEPIPGDTPKMFGRHFDEKDFLVSKISRQSIDACKDYFRDDLVKSDWQLIVELKKLFQIL